MCSLKTFCVENLHGSRNNGRLGLVPKTSIGRSFQKKECNKNWAIIYTWQMVNKYRLLQILYVTLKKKVIVEATRFPLPHPVCEKERIIGSKKRMRTQKHKGRNKRKLL